MAGQASKDRLLHPLDLYLNRVKEKKNLMSMEELWVLFMYLQLLSKKTNRQSRISAGEIERSSKWYAQRRDQ